MALFDGLMTECSLKISRTATPLSQMQGQLSFLHVDLLLCREGLLQPGEASSMC